MRCAQTLDSIPPSACNAVRRGRLVIAGKKPSSDIKNNSSDSHAVNTPHIPTPRVYAFQNNGMPPQSACATSGLYQSSNVSWINEVLRRRQPAAVARCYQRLLRQYLYLCTSKARKLSTTSGRGGGGSLRRSRTPFSRSPVLWRIETPESVATLPPACIRVCERMCVGESARA